MRALIIDDSRANRMVLQKYLRQFGFETVEAENGADAIWLVGRDANFQLITVDYHMPGMTGVQLVRLIREKKEFANVPILMISVEDRMERQSEALEAGVNEFLVKPFTRDMIETKLRLLGALPDEDEMEGADPPPSAESEDSGKKE